MSADIQELMDKNAIIELIIRLSYAFDERDGAKMRSVFADRVDCDIGAQGNNGTAVVSTVDADWLCEVSIANLSQFDMTQHMNGMHLVTVDGDEAKLTAYVIGSHYLSQRTDARAHERAEPWNTIGARYDMRARRGADGWRFTAWKWRMTWTRDNYGVWDEITRRLAP